MSRELGEEKEPATRSSGRKAEPAQTKYKVLKVGTAHVVVGRLKEWWGKSKPQQTEKS